MSGAHDGRPRKRTKQTLARVGLCLSAMVTGAMAEDASAPAPAPAPTPVPAAPEDGAAFKTLSLEQLMDVEVVSSSRHAQRLSESPSAIQVVTSDDIHSSGAIDLADALRLAPNLQVAQVNASQWAISSRGFNNVLADKLLVMIDGRSVYTPLYGGVFWDVQNVMLEDVDRIEVVSGPGGTLWGANAVNGVINILSKSAEDTQGAYVSAGAGTAVRDTGAVRYGGAISPDLFYRVYGERFDRNSTILPGGQDPEDNWYMSQGGFRMDWIPGQDHVTLQGDIYGGRPDPDGGSPVDARGGNVLGRLTHTISKDADFQLQAYYDQTWRNFNNGFTERVGTYDVDWQNRFPLCGWQEVTWGLGYRLIDDTEQDLDLFGFWPAHKIFHLPSAFAQDDVALIKDRLHLILGSKFEHNDYTGFEYQPSGRLAWTPSSTQTFWAAVSRAVRTPSRTDTDFAVKLTPTLAFLQGNSDFDSEKLTAYELGWRAQPQPRVSLSVSLYYNRYDDIRSAEPGPPPFGIPITLDNDVYGDTYGAEVAAELLLTDWWYVRGGYSFLKKQLRVKPGGADLNNATAESDDPNHQALIQSTVELPAGFEFGSVIRYVAALPSPHVPSYIELNLRLGYKPTEHLELSVVGQNLLDHSHPEFVPTSPSAREIERSVYGNLAVRW